jgi:hypothetical protein
MTVFISSLADSVKRLLNRTRRGISDIPNKVSFIGDLIDTPVNRAQHKKFLENLDVITELCGDPKNCQFSAPGGNWRFKGAHPDDADAREQLCNFFAQKERKLMNEIIYNSKATAWLLGGPTGNLESRELLGWKKSDHPHHLKWTQRLDIGTRFISLSDKTDPRVKDSFVKHYLAKPHGKQISQREHAWRWIDHEGELPDFYTEPDSEKFQKWDYLKLTKIRTALIIDGLHGLGTRSIGKLFENGYELKRARDRLRAVLNMGTIPPNQSYEAIFNVRVSHNHDKHTSTPTEVSFSLIEPFIPRNISPSGAPQFASYSNNY